jgi:transposase
LSLNGLGTSILLTFQEPTDFAHWRIWVLSGFIATPINYLEFDMKEFNTIALFRLSVLGPLVSRERLERGELQTIIRNLASKEYAIPGSDRRFLGEKTIEAWYYAWRAHGIDGLIPQQRTDRGVSKLPATVQEALLAAKQENPRRSIRQLKILLENAGLVSRDTLSRSAIHRFCNNKACRVRRVPHQSPRNIAGLSLNGLIQSGMAMSCMVPR